MLAFVIDRFVHLLSLAWLTGPVFEKELRVSSRRRRNYSLRFVYIALLTIAIVLIWINVVRWSGSNAGRIARMSEAGKMIVTTIIWFQFCAAILVAIVMCSTAISDELYHKTLGVLMTTPINSFQIVMGKLFSKLLQLILLLAISLPLLAIVRVFGGVAWDYIIRCLCATFTAVLFVASLSLLFSIFSKRAYVVIIMTILTVAFMYVLVPIIIMYTAVALTDWGHMSVINSLFFVHPVFFIAAESELLFRPGARSVPSWSLLGHCSVMLAGTAAILSLAITTVRKVALRQAVGQLGTSYRSRRAIKKAAAAAKAPMIEKIGRYKRITGSPVLWKELRSPLLGRHKKIAITVIAATVALVGLSYLLCAMENDLDDDETHMVYASIFGGMGMLFAIVLPATSITSEKESGCWPGLLATTIGDGHIVAAKFVGLLRRCGPIWIFLFAHLAIFISVGYIHLVAFFQMAIIAIWLVVFLSGTGLYFSSLFRRTTTAVVANFALALFLWLAVPALMFLTLEILHESDNLAEDWLEMNPVVQTIVVLEATGDRGYNLKKDKDLRYHWPGRSRGNALQTTWKLLAFMIVYMLIGVLFAWRAKCRLRRNVF